MKGCWTKMISNALKWKAKPERKMQKKKIRRKDMEENGRLPFELIEQ